MIAHRYYFVLMLLFLMLVPCAFSQRTGQGTSALARFHNALKHDGFDVSTGAAVALNLGAAYCSGTYPTKHGLAERGGYVGSSNGRKAWNIQDISQPGSHRGS